MEEDILISWLSSPRPLSLSSYGRCSSPFSILVALRWTHSSQSMSLVLGSGALDIGSQTSLLEAKNLRSQPKGELLSTCFRALRLGPCSPEEQHGSRTPFPAKTTSTLSGADAARVPQQKSARVALLSIHFFHNSAMLSLVISLRSPSQDTISPAVQLGSCCRPPYSLPIYHCVF